MLFPCTMLPHFRCLIKSHWYSLLGNLFCNLQDHATAKKKEKEEEVEVEEEKEKKNSNRMLFFFSWPTKLKAITVMGGQNPDLIKALGCTT